MRYSFGDYVYDPMRMSLLRVDVELALPKRVHACLSYLIRHRERVIQRDELIWNVWGRDNVSDHQLAQIIRAARQALGDNGTCQHMIRTVIGVGYRWSAETLELVVLDPQPSQANGDTVDSKASPAIEPYPAKSIPLAAIESIAELDENLASLNDRAVTAQIEIWNSAPRGSPIGRMQSTRRSVVRSITLAVAAIVAIVAVPPSAPSSPQASTATHAGIAPTLPGDPLDRLVLALSQGRFEVVREGLAQLPDALSDSADAKLLDIDLDIERGRWQSADQKLQLQLQRVRSLGSADLSWQAQLLILQAKFQQRSGAPRPEAVATAQAAVDLLKSMPTPAEPALLASAKLRLASAWITTGRLDDATLGFTEARDIFLEQGDRRLATQASCGLARVWMRQGRLAEALEQLESNAVIYSQLDDPVSELLARNTALRLQVELLRLPEALVSSDRAMQLLERVPDFERRYRTLQLRALVLTGLGRLREAGSILEDAEARRPADQAAPSAGYIATIHQLATKDYAKALDSAQNVFSNSRSDPRNVLLEGRDGALLLWVMAAEGVASRGESLPTPNPAQQALLLQPESTLGRIAQGRWLGATGQTKAAESALRLAMTNAREQHRLLQSLLAGSALIDLLGNAGYSIAAERVLVQMRAQHPQRVDETRRTWRLTNG